MGRVTAARGHLVLLAGGACYRMRAVGGPGVVLIQTIQGPDTVFRWAEICQSG
jgi:hypothetical protein